MVPSSQEALVAAHTPNFPRTHVPYSTKAYPETLAALRSQRIQPIMVEMETDHSYFDLLSLLWSQTNDFVIVEQDIVVHRFCLTEFYLCAQPWCSYAYPYMGSLHAGLGCTRFRRELMFQYPDAVKRTSQEETDVHPQNHWCNMDDRLRRVLQNYQVTQHVHSPPVEHLNDMPSHGCVPAL